MKKIFVLLLFVQCMAFNLVNANSVNFQGPGDFVSGLVTDIDLRGGFEQGGNVKSLSFVPIEATLSSESIDVLFTTALDDVHIVITGEKGVCYEKVVSVDTDWENFSISMAGFEAGSYSIEFIGNNGYARGEFTIK